MTTTPAADDETVEFTLRPYRRPLRWGEALALGLCAIAIFCWVGGGLFLWAHAPRWVGVLGGGAAVLIVLGLWWWSDHRRYPPGALRLGPAGLVLDDGRRLVALGYGELRYLVGTGLGLVLKGPGRRLLVDWPRFSPAAPRQVVEAVLVRLAVLPDGARILERTRQQSRRSAGLGRFFFWVFLANGVLMLLRLLLERAGPPG